MPTPEPHTPLQIDADRLSRELDHLASLTRCEQTGITGERAVTRVVFSEEDMQARAWLKSLYAEAGLVVREDAVGNTFARWPGTDLSAAAIGTGSHTDAIPHAGMFDGTVGVLGGLEAIRTLQRSGFAPRSSIELLMFTAEEPTRFGIGCLGSRLIAGSLDASRADALQSAYEDDSRSLRDIRTTAGFSGDLAKVRLAPGYYSAWVELHIEQGPLLEREGLDIGIVEAIAAPASYRIHVDGFGGHAGALLMPDRRDALCAAAELILEVESAALATGVIDTVATVGTAKIHPGAVNSVPSRVDLELDVRDTDPRRRDTVLEAVRRKASELETRRGVRIVLEEVNADEPARSDARIVAAAEAACDAHGLCHRRMVSRAYHDTLFLTGIAPTAMLFLPCRNGTSHRPDEFATVEALRNGVTVLAEMLRTLAT